MGQYKRLVRRYNPVKRYPHFFDIRQLMAYLKRHPLPPPKDPVRNYIKSCIISCLYMSRVIDFHFNTYPDNFCVVVLNEESLDNSSLIVNDTCIDFILRGNRITREELSKYFVDYYTDDLYVRDNYTRKIFSFGMMHMNLYLDDPECDYFIDDIKDRIFSCRFNYAFDQFEGKYYAEKPRKIPGKSHDPSVIKEAGRFIPGFEPDKLKQNILLDDITESE